MSRLLVSAQLLLIVLIAAPLGIPSRAPALTVASVALFVLGMLAAAAALAVMPARTFSVLPEPRDGGALVTRGIYRSIRHPICTWVCCCAAWRPA